MKFHLRSVCTALVLLAVLVTPSFSGLRDKGLKVQTVPVEGLEVRNSVVLAQGYALVAPYNPTKLPPGEPITAENKKELDNNEVLVFDPQNLGDPRRISLGGCYFPELSFHNGLVVCQGTDFVLQEGANGPELAPIKVIAYFWLSLDEDKSKVGSEPVRIEIPGTDDGTTAEAPSSVAVLGRHLVFTNNQDLFTYNIDDGTLGTHPMASDYASKSTLEIVGVHEDASVLAITNQITGEGEGNTQIHETELRFLRVESNGTVSLIRAFSPEKDNTCIVPGSNVAFVDDPDGNPLAGYCIDNMGNLREYAFEGDGDGASKILVQFPGLAQDPNIAYAALCPRYLQLLDRVNLVASRAGRIAIRRPAFGRPTGSAGIRRPAFITSEERVGVSIGRLPKSKHGGLISRSGEVSITGDLSAAFGDDVSALIARPGDNPGDPTRDLLILLKQGSVFTLAFSTVGDPTAILMYEGDLGGGDVVAGANAGDQLAALRASAGGDNTESATSESRKSGSLVIARMKPDKRDLGVSSVAFSVAQASASIASPPSKKVPPSIRRPCNVER